MSTDRLYSGNVQYTFKKIKHPEPGFDYQLKPCPFCGSQDAQIIEYDVKWNDQTNPCITENPECQTAYSVRCPMCKAEIFGLIEWEVEDAVDSWNRRG